MGHRPHTADGLLTRRGIELFTGPGNARLAQQQDDDWDPRSPSQPRTPKDEIMAIHAATEVQRKVKFTTCHAFVPSASVFTFSSCTRREIADVSTDSGAGCA